MKVSFFLNSSGSVVWGCSYELLLLLLAMLKFSMLSEPSESSSHSFQVSIISLQKVNKVMQITLRNSHFITVLTQLFMIMIYKTKKFIYTIHSDVQYIACQLKYSSSLLA